MPTFTAVIHHKVALNLEAWSIDQLVAHFRDLLLEDAPAGAKCRVEHSLIENKAGEKFALATIHLMNQRSRVVDKALVYSEQPEVPGQRYHANRGPGEYIMCQQCKTDLFYDIGRGRFYNHHVCAGCGAPAQTLTETGACT